MEISAFSCSTREPNRALTFLITGQIKKNQMDSMQTRETEQANKQSHASVP